MKITFFKVFTLLSSLLLLFSCNISEYKEITNPNYDSNKILNYVSFENGKYSMSINETTAVLLGFSVEDYQKLSKTVINANECLQDCISKFSEKQTIKSIHSYDYTNNYKSKIIIKPKAQNDSEEIINNNLPSGALETNTSDLVFIRIWAPDGMVGLNCYCFSNSSLSAFQVVITRFLGSLETFSIIGNGEVAAYIDTSNCYGTIGYRTTDSFGGYCSYSAFD